MSLLIKQSIFDMAHEREGARSTRPARVSRSSTSLWNSSVRRPPLEDFSVLTDLKPLIPTRRSHQASAAVDLPDSLEGVVTVRASSVHGLGVFAVAGIARNSLLGRYGGRLRAAAGDARTKTDDYVFSLSDDCDWVIDGFDQSAASWARFINHAPHPRNNVIFTSSGCLRTRADIAPGDELLVDYGGAYWFDAKKESIISNR